MNKKFSTLMMAGMLVAGSSFVDAQTLNGLKLKKIDFQAGGKNTYKDVVVVRDVNNDGKIDAGDIIMTASKKNDGTITYETRKFNNWSNIVLENQEEAIWDFTETKSTTPGSSAAQGWFYQLINHATGKPLAGTGVAVEGQTVTPTVITEADKSKEDPANNLYAYFKTAWDNADGVIKYDNTSTTANNKGNVLFLAWPQNGNSGLIMDEPTNSNTTGKVHFAKVESHWKVGILLATAEEREVDFVTELNDIQGGEGFQFSFKDDDKVSKNVFDNKDLRAFNVPEIAWGKDGRGNIFMIPKGIYLASDWSNLSENTLKFNTISTVEEFQKATFIAVLPQEFVDLTNTTRANGHGFALGEVKGADMNFYAIKYTEEGYEANQASSHAEVFVGNACFTITAENPLTLNDNYKLELKEVRLATDAKQEDVHADVENVYIGTTNNTNNDNDEVAKNNYLTTQGNAITVTAVPSSSQADAKALLNEGAIPVPAIYTLEFIGGKADGQFLTTQANRSKNGFEAATMPSIFVNEDDPMYQFVVSNVEDKVKNADPKVPVYETITLTNRQTKEDVSFVLYNTTEEDVYIIYPTAMTKSISFAENSWDGEELQNEGKWFWNYYNVKGQTVKFNKKESVDKFATFESRESYDGLVSFQFAKTEESGDRLYAAANRYAKGDNKGEIIVNNHWASIITGEELTDQFELIRSDKYQYITNDFKYINANGNIVTSPTVQDTVAFYSYVVKLFNPDEADMYLTDTKLTTWPAFFVIKENKDGSVALFENEWDNNNFTQNNPFIFFDKKPNPNAAYYKSAIKGNPTEKDNVGEKAWSENWAHYYDLTSVANAMVKTFMVDEPVYGTLNPVKQTTTFESGLNYLFRNESNVGILKPEVMSFDLTPADVKTNVPSFFIANEGNFMYFAKDSADSYRLTNWEKYAFEDGNGVKTTRVIFKAAELNESSDSLTTTVDGQIKTVAEKANKAKGILGGLKNFKFRVIDSEDGDDSYVVRCVANNKYVIAINGQLTVTSDRAGATRFFVETTELPTANEGVEVSGVKVIAGEGNVTIAGAQGKKVVISNILGQVVANTVIASDNATIAAPAGVAVIAIEGEAAVKAIVK